MLRKNYQKKIELPQNIDFFIATVQDKTFFVAQTKFSALKYILIPTYIEIIKVNTLLYFSLKSLERNDLILFNKDVLFFFSWLKRISKPSRKKLILKGLGFKVTFSDDKKYLQFKLGYSHSIHILLPNKDIFISLDKNILIVEGFDRIMIGNFINCIRNLRFPDSYKGKGFWFRNEILTLKEVKKT